MQQSSIDFLNNNRHHYESYTKARFVKNFGNDIRAEMLAVVRKEFDPGYNTALWCGDCVMNMLVFCYQQYDKYLAEQNKVVS